ncbi:MAG TPA: hypothetical protein PK771_01190 [Spirochaetota bacterium]|nr:hypothetical protein [Spirochaetota bacterium]
MKILIKSSIFLFYLIIITSCKAKELDPIENWSGEWRLYKFTHGEVATKYDEEKLQYVISLYESKKMKHARFEKRTDLFLFHKNIYIGNKSDTHIMKYDPEKKVFLNRYDNPKWDVHITHELKFIDKDHLYFKYIRDNDKNDPEIEWFERVK